jgi:hypothetical protein
MSGFKFDFLKSNSFIHLKQILKVGNIFLTFYNKNLILEIQGFKLVSKNSYLCNNNSDKHGSKYQKVL